MAKKMSSGEDTRSALELCLLSLAGYGLLYGLGVFLARALGESEVEIPVLLDQSVNPQEVFGGRTRPRRGG